MANDRQEDEAEEEGGQGEEKGGEGGARVATILGGEKTAMSGAIAKAQESLEELGDLKGSEEHGLPQLWPNLWTVAVEPREQMLVAWGPASSPRSWTSTSTRG